MARVRSFLRPLWFLPHGESHRAHHRHDRRAKPANLQGELLEPRRCLSAEGLPGGVYRVGNLNQADGAMLADVARARYGVDGSGIKIGIISVSFDNLGGATADIARGTLPEHVQVLHDNLDSDEDDEGRAMAQLVHAIAPGAELVFAAGWDSSLPSTPETLLVTWQDQFAERIRELVDAGCSIIVDDLGLATEPWFQDGPISQAVDDAVRRGTAYFVAAANDSNFSYESVFRPAAPPAALSIHPDFAGRSLQFHDFDPGETVDVFQRISLPLAASQTSPFVVQWDQPWGQNNSTVEVWFFDQNKNPIGPAIGVEAYPVALRELGEMLIPGGGTLPALGSEFYVSFAHVLDDSESPGFFKWMTQLNGPGTINGTGEYGSVEFAPFGASTAVGHYNSSLGGSVGAAPYWETPAYGRAVPQLTNFSSWGGTPLLFDTLGTRLESPDYRQQPRFVAPQQGDTTFFPGPHMDTEHDGLPNFQGTSAAAPNAAAVAALMLELDPSLTPAEIYRILAGTAVPMTTPDFRPPGVSGSFNFATGAGMIHAERALAHVAGLTIAGTVFEDFDRSGVPSDDELPIAGVTVFLDSNGNGIRDHAPALGSGASFVTFEAALPTQVGEAERVANPNRQLPEQQADEYLSHLTWPAKAYGRIDVTAMPGTVTDLEVRYSLRGESPAVEQIPVFVTLVNPAGIRVPLVGTTLEGGTFWNPDTSLVVWNLLPGMDTETLTISSSSFGHRTPASLASLVDLTAFSNMPANGAWYLEVSNPDPDRTYMLDTWSLSLRTAEQSTVTDANGSYVFSSELLTLSSGRASVRPTLELPENRRLTSGTASRHVELSVGDHATVNFAISLPTIQRPELLPTATIRIDDSGMGPHPAVFSWAQLAVAVLPELSGMRFILSSVQGRVEKRIGGEWIEVSNPPSASSPQELLAMLRLRTIQPGDELRWIPRTQLQERGPAFVIIGWDGLATTATASEVAFAFESLSTSGL